MNIYVGNLTFEVTEEELKQAFEAFGKVDSVSIIKDKFSGKSRGFGFVEMAENGEQAISGLNGSDLNGRALKVNEAKPRDDNRRSRGKFGGSGGGGGRSNRGDRGQSRRSGGRWDY